MNTSSHGYIWSKKMSIANKIWFSKRTSGCTFSFPLFSLLVPLWIPPSSLLPPRTSLSLFFFFFSSVFLLFVSSSTSQPYPVPYATQKLCLLPPFTSSRPRVDKESRKEQEKKKIWKKKSCPQLRGSTKP